MGQFIAGDMCFFIDARVWSLYIVFMINGVQCWMDANQCVVECDALHSQLKWEWVSGIRHSNACAWALLSLAAALCCYAWSKMELRETIAGQALIQLRSHNIKQGEDELSSDLSV